MSTRIIYVIRHAEKPVDRGKAQLSVRGRERAAALGRNAQELFGHLDYLFAAKTSTRSARPVETVSPLALHFGLEIDSSYRDKDHDKLARDLLDSKLRSYGTALLICWDHENIPALARALEARQAPAKWPNTVFDRIWKMTLRTSQPVEFENIPQRLLSGDSPT